MFKYNLNIIKIKVTLDKNIKTKYYNMIYDK